MFHINSSWLVFDEGYSIFCGTLDVLFPRHGTNAAILPWLIVEVPFSVRVEDGTPVTTGFLQIANNTGTSMAETRI